MKLKNSTKIIRQFSSVLILVFCWAGTYAQSQNIKGTVLDNENQAIAGVNVIVKGIPGRGTTTDANGKFSINVDNENNILVFSFIGFTTKEIVAGNKTDLNVRLEYDSKALGEVVIVGYGAQKKANLTAAVDQVSAKALENRAMPNLT
ncbi:carboxypeptidase-like regulatory domain-containing protein [Daejeonella sp.]|uniref:carboxypeptidase-like regulatory domain-containing protein n=1 Tax=Daejeonella sp. TaxID=2805397 RepID=UPI002720CD01|nr:carboxypeptidase-like regulatory domain-containing protein [Daejeonella sp.]MDO8992164.1 carboxypeptidase-like regulatory domain-containing protein [Daejeonella sp.]MDP2414229.1 carboxypeptidase-like regulatory domain-containing protein [Daejeonella sp.]